VTPAEYEIRDGVSDALREKGLLRLLTCGSVDDGKSTLIGRLLYDSRSVYEDQVQSIAKSTVNRAGVGLLDLSLLTDGLRAEREQGITIDVAYRYFSTAKRKFILADTPGHEQFTRNMATGASTADLAIILIDARHGVLPQSRRHAQICALLGIRHVVVAINKMDLAAYSEARYEEIRREFAAILDGLGFRDPYFLPVSALAGDNVVTEASANMPWFDGPALLEYLETVEVETAGGDFRMPVQLVVRPDLHFRGYAGQIASGTVRVGDPVAIWPGGKGTRIARIVTYDGDLKEAAAPQSVTLVLEDELDVARGSLIAAAERSPIAARRFRADIVWMQERPLDSARMWLVKHGTRTVRARLIRLHDRLDIATLTRGAAAGALGLNDIGLAEFEAVSPLHFDPYAANRAMGAIILIDPETNATAGAGMIRGAVESAFRPVTASERAGRFGHGPGVVKLGGRRPLASRLERRIFDRGGVAVMRDRASVDVLEAFHAAGVIVILVEEAGPFRAADDATACEQILRELFVDAGVDSGEAI